MSAMDAIVTIVHGPSSMPCPSSTPNTNRYGRLYADPGAAGNQSSLDIDPPIPTDDVTIPARACRKPPVDALTPRPGTLSTQAGSCSAPGINPSQGSVLGPSSVQRA